MADDISNIEARVKNKTDVRKTERLEKELKRFAPYEDLKILYNKTLIPMQKYEAEMINFYADFR